MSIQGARAYLISRRADPALPAEHVPADGHVRDAARGGSVSEGIQRAKGFVGRTVRPSILAQAVIRADGHPAATRVPLCPSVTWRPALLMPPFPLS